MMKKDKHLKRKHPFIYVLTYFLKMLQIKDVVLMVETKTLDDIVHQQKMDDF